MKESCAKHQIARPGPSIRISSNPLIFSFRCFANPFEILSSPIKSKEILRTPQNPLESLECTNPSKPSKNHFESSVSDEFNESLRIL